VDFYSCVASDLKQVAREAEVQDLEVQAAEVDQEQEALVLELRHNSPVTQAQEASVEYLW